MNAEELTKEFASSFPNEIEGYKRPAEPLTSGHDFFLNIPQMIPNDDVMCSDMNLILSVLLSNR